MTHDVVSKATRQAFRDILSGWYLREISDVFDLGDLKPDLNFTPPSSGQRRTLVEQYLHAIDFRSPKQVAQVLVVFGGVVRRLDEIGLSNPPTKVIADRLKVRLQEDGYRYEAGRFSPIHAGIGALVMEVRSHAANFGLPALQQQITRAMNSVESDPALAIGTAKELVETTCKTILEQIDGADVPDELPKLVRATQKALNLLPDDVPESAKGNETIKRMLSNLGQMTQGLAELRNLYGTGHGPSGRKRGLSSRHARLARISHRVRAREGLGG